MNSNRKLKRALLAALLLICLISFTGYQYLFEDNAFVIYGGNDGIKYALYFLWLLMIAAAGYWAWKRNGVHWIVVLWLTTYSGGIAFLLFAGVADLYLYSFPHALKEDVRAFRILLMSPVPFMLCYLFQYLVARNPSGKSPDKRGNQ